MPVTITYDFSQVDPNDRNYIRSALERFHFRRIGGSVFRYIGTPRGGETYEDWLNHIAPAIMFFRSFIMSRNIKLKFFTIDSFSISQVDHSDPDTRYGEVPKLGQYLDFAEPTNSQSSVEALRTFVDCCVRAAPTK
jgi:hypothetical protein